MEFKYLIEKYGIKIFNGTEITTEVLNEFKKCGDEIIVVGSIKVSFLARENPWSEDRFQVRDERVQSGWVVYNESQIAQYLNDYAFMDNPKDIRMHPKVSNEAYDNLRKIASHYKLIGRGNFMRYDSDDEDFHDCAKWDIEAALVAAYKLGSKRQRRNHETE